MLLIVSDSLRHTKSVSDVVRELSLALSFFDSPKALSKQMRGTTRRIFLLDKDDVNDDIVKRLKAHQDRVPFAFVIAADRATVSRHCEPELLESLLEFPTFEWLSSGFDAFKLGDSIKRLRRRMLQFSREEIEAAFDNLEYTVRYQPKNSTRRSP